MLLSCCTECPAARLAAVSMLRWWLTAKLLLPASVCGAPAGLAHGCCAMLARGSMLCCAGPPWLLQTA